MIAAMKIVQCRDDGVSTDVRLASLLRHRDTKVWLWGHSHELVDEVMWTAFETTPCAAVRRARGAVA